MATNPLLSDPGLSEARKALDANGGPNNASALAAYNAAISAFHSTNPAPAPGAAAPTYTMADRDQAMGDSLRADTSMNNYGANNPTDVAAQTALNTQYGLPTGTGLSGPGGLAKQLSPTQIIPRNTAAEAAVVNQYGPPQNNQDAKDYHDMVYNKDQQVHNIITGQTNPSIYTPQQLQDMGIDPATLQLYPKGSGPGMTAGQNPIYDTAALKAQGLSDAQIQQLQASGGAANQAQGQVNDLSSPTNSNLRVLEAALNKANNITDQSTGPSQLYGQAGTGTALSTNALLQSLQQRGNEMKQNIDGFASSVRDVAGTQLDAWNAANTQYKNTMDQYNKAVDRITALNTAATTQENAMTQIAAKGAQDRKTQEALKTLDTTSTYGTTFSNGDLVSSNPDPNRQVLGYDFTSYATDPNWQNGVKQYTQATSNLTSATQITKYIQSVAPKSKITGDMVLASADKYGVPPSLILGIAQQEAAFGTKGRAANTFNPGNVGNTDSGANVNYGSWQSGLDALANNINRRKVGGQDQDALVNAPVFGALTLNDYLKTSNSGKQYLTLDNVTDKDEKLAVTTRARALGVPILNAADASIIDEIDSAKNSLDQYQSALKDLGGYVPKDWMGRPEKITEQNIASFIQSDPKLASIGVYRDSAIKVLKALAGTKGLRINKAEIDQVGATLPLPGDTADTQAHKLQNITGLINGNEDAILGKTKSKNVAPQVTQPQNAFSSFVSNLLGQHNVQAVAPTGSANNYLSQYGIKP